MYKEILGIHNEHNLKETNSEWKQKRGQDTDTTWYDEIDIHGDIVARYIIIDSTSIYPPFSRTVKFKKYSLDGNLINSGNLDIV